jgi:hypothetical protein
MPTMSLVRWPSRKLKLLDRHTVSNLLQRCTVSQTATSIRVTVSRGIWTSLQLGLGWGPKCEQISPSKPGESGGPWCIRSLIGRVELRPLIPLWVLSGSQLDGTPSTLGDSNERIVHQNLQTVISSNATRPSLVIAR